MKDGHKEIEVLVMVADGDSCKIKTKLLTGMCYFYVSKSCRLFNKVIVDHKKCTKCLGACK